jgi:hypothetical protein
MNRATQPSSDHAVKGAMQHCKLRIAFTIAFGIASLSLLVLLVRSYWLHEETAGSISSSQILSMSSDRGQFAFGIVRNRPHVDFHYVHTTPTTQPSRWRLQYVSAGDAWVAYIPYWFPALVFGTFAAVPWVRCRFSLRTMLIATTLVAVALGLIVSLQ